MADSISLYNFVTNKTEKFSFDKEDLADYIPQTSEALSLYDAYAAQDVTPLDALNKTLITLIENELIENHEQTQHPIQKI